MDKKLINNDTLFDLKNKVIVITGSASGIGKKFCSELILRGAKIIGLYHISENKKNIVNHKNFVSYPIELEKIDLNYITQIWEHSFNLWNKIPDILINCAGINIHNSFENYEISDFEKVMDINLNAVYKLSQSFAKTHIYNSIPGKIINISSLLAFQTGWNCTGYTVSKHALNGLTKIMANEIGQYGITVNSIAPGFIYTKMTSKFIDNKKISDFYLKRISLGRWGGTK